MRINSKGNTQYAAFVGDGSGEGLAIFLSQNGRDVTRYRFLVMARIDEGTYQVGTFYSSPPNATAIPGRLSRMVAAAVCPGATSWSVEITALDISGSITPETSDVILTSSPCYSSPVGVSRVAERYGYFAGSAVAPQDMNVPAGQTVTRIQAVGLAGGGTFNLAGGVAVTVPAGVVVSLEPKAPVPFGLAAIHFVNVDWTVEFLESA